MNKKIFLMIIVFFLLSFVYSSPSDSIYDLSDQQSFENINFKVQNNIGGISHYYALDIPKGVNDLAPSIKIFYNNYNSYDYFIGNGFDISRNYIQRNINYTRNDTRDDYFLLYFQDNAYELIYNFNDSLYHTKTEAYFNIRKISGGNNTNNEYWFLRDKFGNEYRFGYNEDSEEMSNKESYTSNWYLDLITDKYDNSIYYSYLENPFPNEIGATYLYKIEYNNDKSKVIEFVFSSVDSTDKRKTFVQGNEVVFSRKLNNILIKVNNSLLLNYSFFYEDLEYNKKILNYIKIGDYNGSNYKYLNFSYYELEKGWNYTSLLKSPVVPSISSRFIDLNRDGFVDILNGHLWKNYYNVNQLGSSTIYLNNGTGWVSQAGTLPTSLSVVTGYLPVCSPNVIGQGKFDRGGKFLDLNSDGFFDYLFLPDNGNYGQDKGQSALSFLNYNLNWTQENNYLPPISSTVTYQRDSDFCSGPEGSFAYMSGLDTGYRFVDLNGDGRDDLIGNSVRYLNLEDGWHSSSDWSVPYEIVYTKINYDCESNGDELEFKGVDNGVRFVDVNGDGLIDLLYSNYNAGIKKVYLNDGKNFALESSWIIPEYFVKNDLWGDPECYTRYGIDQGVRFVDVNSDGLVDLLYGFNGVKKVYINTGSGWAYDSSFVLPKDFIYSKFDYGAEGYVYTDTGVVVADIDADGSLDLLNSNLGVWISNSNHPYLLKSITNEFGGKIEIGYGKSTDYDNTGSDSVSDLGFNVWLVSNVTEYDGMGNVIVTSYNYSGGLYNYTENEFRGFNFVEEKLGDRIIKHWYYQTDALNGYEYKKEIYENDTLFSEVLNSWNFLDKGGYYVVTLNNVSEIIFNNETNKTKISEYSYDNFGNIIYFHNFGDVEITSDDYYIFNDYVINETAWIVNTIKSKRIFGSDNLTKLSEMNYSYDGLNYGDLPIRGDITKEEEWNNNGENIILHKSYDSFGNLINERDGREFFTNYTYDESHVFVNEITDSKGFVIEYGYSLLFEKPNWIKDSNGNYVNYSYDGFGRVLSEIMVYDSVVYPTKVYEYNFDGVAPEKMKISYRENNGSSESYDVYNFYDGFNKLIQVKSEARNNNQIVKNFFYDEFDRVVDESNYYFSDFSNSYSSPDFDISNLSLDYDVLDRVILQVNPDGTRKSVVYDLWNVSYFDENGNRIDNILDSKGNIIAVKEYNGNETYFTLYSYDGLGNLVSIKDNGGNWFNFSYDSLGRKISELDPDLGLIEYGYDANGNLIWENRAYGGLISDAEFVRSYNELGQLVNVSLLNETLVESYFYDGLGVRIKTYNAIKNETTYTPFREFMMIVNSTGIYNYTYVYSNNTLIAKINPDGSKWFYHSDSLGSTSLITDEEGNVIEDNWYLPYGLPMIDSNEKKLYEGMEYSHDIEEYNYGFRNYNPELMIFTKADSIIPNVYDPQQLNKYSFERNNPYRYVDNDGHNPVIIGASLGVFAIYTYNWITSYSESRDSQKAYSDATSSAIGATAGVVSMISASSVGVPSLFYYGMGNVLATDIKMGTLNIMKGNNYGEGASKEQEFVGALGGIFGGKISEASGTIFGDIGKLVTDIFINPKIEKSLDNKINFNKNPKNENFNNYWDFSLEKMGGTF